MGPERKNLVTLGRLKFGPVIVFDPYSSDPAAACVRSRGFFFYIQSRTNYGIKQIMLANFI